MVQARTIPPLWLSQLPDLPEAFHHIAIANAWAIHDRVMDNPHFGAYSVKIRDMVQINSAINTALSALNYPKWLPLHLVGTGDELALARHIWSTQGVMALVKMLDEHYPEENRKVVLVCGDCLDAERIATVVGASIRAWSVAMFLIGPGPQLELLMKEAALQWGIPAYLARPVDDSLGVSWRQMNAERMNRAAERLIVDGKPDRVLLIEPVTHPATVNIVERAEAKGILIVRNHDEARAPAPPQRRPALAF